MKVIVRRRALNRVLSLVEWTLYGIAVFALSYCFFMLADRVVFQHRADAQLQRMASYRIPGASDRTSGRMKDGDLIGRVNLDRLGISVAVVEGDNASELQHAAGHVDGTALPGKRGNVAIAAHRDTFFRPLKNVRKGDVIRFTTPGGVYRYRVVSTRVVQPDDVGVLRSDGTQELTLVTCYPFYFIGSAPKRFVVQAELQPATELSHLYK